MSKPLASRHEQYTHVPSSTEDTQQRFVWEKRYEELKARLVGNVDLTPTEQDVQPGDNMQEEMDGPGFRP